MESQLENRLEQIIRGLPDALWIRDTGTGAFVYCSPNCGAVWGATADQMVEHPDTWLNLILPEDRPRVREALSRSLAGGLFDQQYRITRMNGGVRWIHDRGSRLRDADGSQPLLAGLARDISEHKNLETEVRKAYDALHSSVDGIIITDQGGSITYANPAFLGLFQFRDFSEAAGTRVEDHFTGGNIEEIADLSRNTSDSGRPTRVLAVKRRDGSRVFVEVSSSVVHDSQGNVVGTMASFLDITERRRREAEARRQHAHLQRLTARMANLEEHERRRISSLIHDTAVQSLSLSNIRLGSVRKALVEAGLEEVAAQLDAAREMIGDGIRQCRLIMGDLTPPLLYELGLGHALKQFAERVRDLQGIAIEVADDASRLPVPESLRGLLFQATRELVLNACKHAAPSRVTVRLSALENSLSIEVCDDGCGFDPKHIGYPARSDSGGFGLFSIRQRLDRAGGALEIKSTPGHGTIVNIAMPLNERPADNAISGGTGEDA